MRVLNRGQYVGFLTVTTSGKLAVGAIHTLARGLIEFLTTHETLHLGRHKNMGVTTSNFSKFRTFVTQNGKLENYKKSLMVSRTLVRQR